MRRAIKKYGKVTLHIAKVLVTGGGGSGKTCTKDILYGKVPPAEHISTDCLEGVPTYCECEKLYLPKDEEFGKWTPAELTDILVMLRNGIMSKVEQEPTGLRSVIVDEDHEDEDDGDAKDQSIPDLGQTGSELLKKINEKGLGGRNMAEFYWIYFYDSAGQSEYLDIIPAFIENVTVTMYVLDLTKPLHKELTDNLGIKGETGPVKADKFTLKGEQVLQAVLQTLRFQSELEKSKLMVVGTHRDVIDDKTVPQRNTEVRQIINSTKCESENFEVIPNGDNTIFELSATEESKLTVDQIQGNKKTASDIRRIVSKECSNKEEIPTTWFLCEEDLRKKGKILTFKECIPVAKQNQIDPEDELKEMLKRFHKLNIFFYYSEEDDLKDTVFTSPHIVMKIVSDIVKDARKSHSAEDASKSHSVEVPTKSHSAEYPKHDPIRLTTQKTISKHSIGMVVKRTHAQIDSEQLEKLIKLLEKRLILVKFLGDSSGEYYYMPCIFPVCENPHEAINKKQAVEQKIVHTPLLIELEGGCAPRGIFNGLVCHFLRQLEFIHDSSNPGLYRNFIHGNYRQNSEFQVSLVNSFHYFEVHVIGPKYKKAIYEQIRMCLENGLEATYKQFYNREWDVPIPVRFLCSGTEDCLKNPHMAKFPKAEGETLICSQNSSVTYKLDSKHLVWLNEEERKHACGK